MIHLTPGKSSDVSAAPDVLAQAPGRMRPPSLIGPMAPTRCGANCASPAPCPSSLAACNRKRAVRHDARRYRDRWRIKAAIAA